MAVKTLVSAGGDGRKRGNILDHLDKLTPSKGGKYFCPVCAGNDLSINKKTGATKCFNSDCSWKSIMDAVAPLKHTGSRAVREQFRTKTTKEKDKIASLSEVQIDTQVTELVWMIHSGSYSVAEASVALAAWCKEHEHNSFAASKLFQEKLSKLKEASNYDEDEAPPKLLIDYRKIEKTFGSELRYNRLFSRVELRGEPFDPATAKIDFVVDHGLKLRSSRDDVGDCVVKLAKQNEYHPVREYLEDCYLRHGGGGGVLEGFARRYLDSDQAIHQIALVKFLVSAVARAYEPGCQVDAALILQGPQGIKKSTFFRTLASPDWFDDSFGKASDKDERLKLHCAWILEWAELEAMFKRKDVSQVKAFITTRVDKLRPPYGRSVETMARSSVFCGTTNQTDFLSDSTGNRRFWVIPVEKEISITQLKKERDQIWAAATALYKSGQIWHLTTHESELMDLSRKQYETVDVWEDAILDWLETKEEVSLQELLSNLLGVELNQQDKRAQVRVRDILIRANWVQKSNPVFYKGKRVRTWVRKTPILE